MKEERSESPYKGRTHFRKSCKPECLLWIGRYFASRMAVEIKNKKAAFSYFLADSYTAGIQLQGTEIKSIRAGKASIGEAYCRFQGDEFFLFNMHVEPYDHAGYVTHEPRRIRKLLLKRTELTKLQRKLRDVGVTVVPTRLFISDSGYAKLDVSVAKGKKQVDKRNTIKDRDQARDLDRGRSRIQ